MANPHTKLAESLEILRCGPCKTVALSLFDTRAILPEAGQASEKDGFL